MNKKVNIDAATLRFLYIKYKQYLLPGGVIAACVLLFIFVIIPQFQNLLSAQEEAKIETNKLNVLKNNLNLLTNLDPGQLNSQLQTVSAVLPADKDFAGILYAVSAAADRAGVSLGDYQFQVGDITKPETQGINSLPYLQLVLSINGGTSDVTRFMQELYKTAPISEVTDVEIGPAVSRITAYFYYRPFPPLGYNDSTPITVVSPEGLNTISNLSSWTNVNGVSNVSNQPTATPSPSPASAASASPAASQSATTPFQ